MSHRSEPETYFLRRVRQIRKAGLTPDRPLDSPQPAQGLAPIEERVKQVLGLIETNTQNPTHVIFFVMYDIENDKIRKEVAKYLEGKGCIRVQKSIFMAELPRKNFAEIHQTLKEVNEVYENNDSILLVPITSDLVDSMKIIGQKIDVEGIIGNPGTLFF